MIQRKDLLAKTITNESGLVLVVVLVLLTVLMLLGATAVMTSTTDLRISGNYKVGQQAFYVAEAGLEHGKIECVKRYSDNGWTSFTPLLDGSTSAAAAGLTFGEAVSFGDGTYRVRVANDAADSGGAAGDTNGAVTLTSVGTVGGGTSTVRATIAINDVPPVSGSISLVGETKTSFAGESFRIDGKNHGLDGTLVNPSNPADGARYGIAVSDVSKPDDPTSDAQAKEKVVMSLSAAQKGNVQGKDYAADPVTPSVGTSRELTKTRMQAFVSAAKSAADNILTNPAELSGNTSGPDNSVTVQNQIEGTYADRTVSLGSVTDPKITYVSKNDGPWAVTGNITGAGLLLIDGSDFHFQGRITWTGLVVVVGRQAAFGVPGSGNGQNITGGLICWGKGAGTNDFEFMAQGGTTVKYSSMGIGLVASAIRKRRPYRTLSWEDPN